MTNAQRSELNSTSPRQRVGTLGRVWGTAAVVCLTVAVMNFASLVSAWAGRSSPDPQHGTAWPKLAVVVLTPIGLLALMGYLGARERTRRQD